MHTHCVCAQNELSSTLFPDPTQFNRANPNSPSKNNLPLLIQFHTDDSSHLMIS